MRPTMNLYIMIARNNIICLAGYPDEDNRVVLIYTEHMIEELDENDTIINNHDSPNYMQDKKNYIKRKA